MKDITPLKYEIENIMGEIDEVGELDFSADEKWAIKRLEALFKKKLKEVVRDTKIELLNELQEKGIIKDYE